MLFRSPRRWRFDLAVPRRCPSPTVYRDVGGQTGATYLACPHCDKLLADCACHPGVAVEVDGGTWTGGRHVRGAGYRRDAEKLNAAAALGWFVYRLTPDMASDPDQVAAIMAATAAVDAAGRG